MKLSSECQILLRNHFNNNAKLPAGHIDPNKAFHLFQNNVIRILEELQLEIEATKCFIIANKFNSYLLDNKSAAVNLSTKEVSLIQQLADKIFHSDVWIQEHQTMKKNQRSPLHPLIFPSEPRGPVSLSGTIELSKKALKPLPSRL